MRSLIPKAAVLAQWGCLAQKRGHSEGRYRSASWTNPKPGMPRRGFRICPLYLKMVMSSARDFALASDAPALNTPFTMRANRGRQSRADLTSRMRDKSDGRIDESEEHQMRGIVQEITEALPERITDIRALHDPARLWDRSS